MCRSMVDIQSATAENRRGKKKKMEDRKNHIQKYNVRIMLRRAAIKRKSRREIRWTIYVCTCVMQFLQQLGNAYINHCSPTSVDFKVDT